ncbi:hypothetical protein ACVIQS_004110 [Bradyrhizobium diazoefficiens]
MLAGDVDRRVRGAAEIDTDALGTIRLHLREGILDLVVLALVGERLVAGPFQLENIEELGGAGVALVLVVERVAVLPELGGVAAGDDVKRDAAAGKLVERCELPRQQCRRGELAPQIRTVA